MKDIIVSFVLPSYNRRDVLARVLLKLREISDKVSCEIIVVDNASNDGSVEMIKALYPQVVLHCNKSNLGAKARNVGSALAKGKYVFMLDDDSYPLGDSLERGIAILEKNKKVGCLAYRVIMPDNRYWTNGLFTVFTGCGALFPKEALTLIGGYPEDILYYAEEYDVSFRLWAKGLKVLNPADLFVFHDKPLANMGFAQRMIQLIINNVNIYSKYLPRQMAISHIEYENWRYKAISEKEGVVDAYRQGLELSIPKAVVNFASERLRLPLETAELALGLSTIRDKFKKFLEQGKVKRAVIFKAGKFLPEIIKIVNSFNVQVEAIIEDNLEMIDSKIEGVIIVGVEELKVLKYDCLISGSSSLLVNDETEQLVASLGITSGNIRFFRTCDYD